MIKFIFISMTNKLIALILKTIFLVYLLSVVGFFVIFSKVSKIKKILLFIISHIVIFCCFLFYIHISLQPIINKIKNGNFYHINNITLLRDNNGIVVRKIGHYNREYISINKVPKILLQTIIAVEDGDFFFHRGLSIKNIFFNLFLGIFTNKKIVGASTITQQVAKNVFLSNEISLKRKCKEIWLAIILSKHISKEEILEIYINHIFFGEDCYGIKSAAKRFFNKDLNHLEINEIAFLVSIIKGPSYYLKKKDKLLERQNYVLKRMYQSGIINLNLYNEYLNKNTNILPKYNNSFNCYNHVKEDVKKNLIDKSLNMEDGYNVYLTINSKLQQVCFNSINQVLEQAENNLLWRGPLGKNNIKNYLEYETDKKKVVKINKEGVIFHHKIKGNIRKSDLEKYNSLIEDNIIVLVEKVDSNDKTLWKLVNPTVLNGAIIVIEPKTGKILSMIGGRGLNYSYVDGIKVIKSPGSIAKLIPLITALEEGYSLNREIPNLPIYIDENTNIKIIKESEIINYINKPGKVVKNHNKKYCEKATLEESLIKSHNIPFILLTKNLGIKKVQNTAIKMGIIEPKDSFYLSSSLGSIYTNFMNIAKSFTVIPNNGYKLNKIYYIERIEDMNHNVIYKEDTDNIMGEKIFSEKTMKTVTETCEKIKKFGIRNKLDMIKSSWSCKTGTAQKNREASFLIWNENYIIYVMVYSMDNNSVENLWGSTLPLYIAKNILIYLDNIVINENNQFSSDSPDLSENQNNNTNNETEAHQ